jgi:hypothetical protein
MKSFSVNQRVVDSGYPRLGVGRIMQVLATHIKVCYGIIVWNYDYPHARRFLREH